MSSCRVPRISSSEPSPPTPLDLTPLRASPKPIQLNPYWSKYRLGYHSPQLHSQELLGSCSEVVATRWVGWGNAYYWYLCFAQGVTRVYDLSPTLRTILNMKTTLLTPSTLAIAWTGEAYSSLNTTYRDRITVFTRSNAAVEWALHFRAESNRLQRCNVNNHIFTAK